MPRRSDLLVLLALCPLLGATQSLSAGSGLGVAVVLIVGLTEALRLAVSPLTAAPLRTATEVLIWTACVTAVDLSLQSWWPGLRRDLGVFLPLLVTASLLRASQPPSDSTRQALLGGLAFCVAALVLGAARELVGQGSLLATLPLLLEPFTTARPSGLSLFAENRAFLVAIMPPGAFLAAALLLAARNALKARAAGQEGNG